jgi:lipid-A-disaccharide synthase
VAGYRVRAIEAGIVRRLIKVTTVLLPNLILGRKVVPEFIQQDCTPQALADAVLAILPDGAPRQAQLAAFDEMHDRMRFDDGESPAAHAVERVRELLASRR